MNKRKFTKKLVSAMLTFTLLASAFTALPAAAAQESRKATEPMRIAQVTDETHPYFTDNLNPIEDIDYVVSGEIDIALETTTLFLNGFFQAIHDKDRVVMSEENYAVTLTKEGEGYAPAEFLKSIGAAAEVSFTEGGVDYASIKEAAESMGKSYIKINALYLIAGGEINKIEILAKDMEKLFGVFAAPGSVLEAGTITAPVSTLDGAKAQVKKIMEDVGYLDGSVTAWFRGGDYVFGSTVSFNESDSGTADCQLIYQAWPGETPSFLGGISVYGSEFEEVTSTAVLSLIPAEARKYVRQIDIVSRGYSMPGVTTNPTGTVLLMDGEAMQIARWPNFELASVGEVVRPGGSRTGIEFHVESERVRSWGKATDAWTIGHWVWEWSTTPLKITSIDAEAGTIGTSTDPRYTPVSIGRKYHVYNLIEELDAENEFFIDRKTGILYLIPYKSALSDGSFKNTRIQVPTLSSTMIDMSNTEYVSLRGFDMQCSKETFVSMSNTKFCDVTGCTIHSTSGSGVVISGAESYRNTVDSCDIYNIGTQGINCYGGNRTELTNGQNLIINNKVHHCVTNTRIGNGFSLGGVENVARYNEIYSMPHTAVGFYGNSTLMEYNEIYDALMDKASDAGAVYTGRNISYWDYVFRYNYLHDLPSTMCAIYQDDSVTGMIAYGNVFYNTGRAIFNHGGEHNDFYNNIMIDVNTDRNAVQYQDCKYLEIDPVAKKILSANPASGWSQRITEYDPAHPTWRERYPEYYHIFYERKWWQYPFECEIERNVTVFVEKTNTRTLEEHYTLENVILQYEEEHGIDVVKLENNHLYEEDIGFVDFENRDFTLKEDSIVYKEVEGFEPIPFEKMGLKSNEWRPDFETVQPFGLTAPYDGEKNIEAREVTFRWREEPSTRKFVFQLATDPEFKNIIREKSVLGNNVTIKNLRYSGAKYYWRAYAYNMNAKNIDKDIVVRCIPEYYTFSTMQNETLDRREAEAQLEEANEMLEGMVDGDGPGEYFAGSRATMEKMVEDFKAEISGENMTQRKLNNAVAKLDSAMATLSGRRNSEILVLDEMLKTQVHWSFQENRAYFTNGEIQFTRTAAGDRNSGGYSLHKLSNHQIVKFKANINTSTWMYFALRDSDTTANYSQSSLYFVVVKPNLIELQKRGPGSMLVEYPNEHLKIGEDAVIEFGALDMEDGSVNIIFKVNGNTVIDYIDSNNPVKDPGYFSVALQSVGDSVTLKPVGEEAPAEDEV